MKKTWLALALLWTMLLPITGHYAHAQMPVVALDGQGCNIPLLSDYDTAYSSLKEALEAVSAQANLSSNKREGFVFTLNQLAASDRYILAFFTITSDKPLAMPGDRSIYGWDAKPGTGLYLDAIIDGNESVDAMLSASQPEVFFQDEHTMVGWGLFGYTFEPGLIPDVCEVKMTASVGSGLLDNRLDISFVLDRSTPLPGFIEMDLNQAISCSFPYDRGGVRNIRLTHLSMSPLGNLLTLEEDVIGPADTQLVVMDENGALLPEVYQGGQTYDASAQHPIKITRTHAFVGGRDASKLYVAPAEYMNKEPSEVFLSLNQTFPHTLAFPGGQQMTVLNLTLDANGMVLRHTNPGWYFSGFNIYDDGGNERRALIGSSDDTFDRGTGVITTRVRWAPEKGAAHGERIREDTLNGLMSISFSDARAWLPSTGSAIEIDLSAFH